MIDFAKLGEQRYKHKNCYQIYCQSAIRKKIETLREANPNYIFNIDEDGEFIEAYTRFDPQILLNAQKN